MIRIKKVTPMFNGVITTMDKYEDDITDNGIIIKKKNSIKEYQKVVAVGCQVREVKEGDLVKVDPSAYQVMKHKPGSLKDGVIDDNVVVSCNFNTIKIDGVEHLYLYERDIAYIINEYEEVDTSEIIKPFKGLV